VQLQRFDAKDFAAASSPAMPRFEAFNKDTGNSTHFMLPETAQIQYLCLTWTC